jgi:hypothetical protein
LSLLIGVAVLAGALLAMQAISRPFGPSPVIRILEENLIIIGWAANRRSDRDFPLRFLPLVRRRNSSGVCRDKCRIATNGKARQEGLA